MQRNRSTKRAKRKRRLLPHVYKEAAHIQAVFAAKVTPANENAREVLLGALLELEEVVAVDMCEDSALVRDFYLLMTRAWIAYLEKPGDKDELAGRIAKRAGRVREVLRRIAAGDKFFDPAVEEWGWPDSLIG